MGKVTIASSNETPPQHIPIFADGEPLVERQILFESPLADNRIVILEECQDELYDSQVEMSFAISEINSQINDLHEQLQNVRILQLEQKPPAVVQTISKKEVYNDEELRSLIQGIIQALEQVQKGQEFINERFRRDINSLRNEEKPISEIIRVHERLPKWVRYGFIFNFILALLGLLT